MPMWVWVAIGLGSFLGLSVLGGIAMARIVTAIGRQLSEMYETEVWARVPPTRAWRAIQGPQPDEVEEKSSYVVQLR
jgi:hypothetical protein